MTQEREHNPDDRREQVRAFALKKAGFDDCRFTDKLSSQHLHDYSRWIEKGLHADMKYLSDHLKFKKDPGLLLKDVRSAIVVIKNYKNTPKRKLSGTRKISRYAAGKDYHPIIMTQLKKITGFLSTQAPQIHCYCAVDSRPVAERSLALDAGIGFLGKNTMVIHPKLGSYFFIGVILTTHDFEPDPPLTKDCGKCRLCIDSCPVNALNEKNGLDSGKCISYLTIERKTPLSPQELRQCEGWIFGCDICQEVCPYNKPSVPLTDWQEFLPDKHIDLSFPSAKIKIPKDSAIYRSRKQFLSNLTTLQRSKQD